MFSQWRTKRQSPMDPGPSVTPRSSSIPTLVVESESARSNSSRSIQPTPSSAHPKTSRKAVNRKGTKSRLAIRDGSGTAPSAMGFVRGPRHASRRSQRDSYLEFGGGVVPGDSGSESEPSDFSESPITPNRHPNAERGSGSNSAPPTTTSFDLNVTAPQHDRDDSLPRLELSQTRSSIDDFRSLLAFASPSLLHGKGLASSASTALSTPDLATAFAASADRSSPLSNRNKPQPPVPTSATTTNKPRTSSSISSADSATTKGQKLPRSPARRMSGGIITVSTNEPRRHAQQPNGVPRQSTVSSLPRSVSQTTSSSYDNDQLRSPTRRTSISEAMRQLEESVQRTPDAVNFNGLGTSSNDSETRRAVLTSNARANTTMSRTNSHSSRRHTKSSSEMSARNSTESWRGGAIGRDILRMLKDAEQLDDTQTMSSLASSKLQGTLVSEGGHSSATDPSTDLNDADQLATIKERIEAPEVALQRQMSIDLGLSPSQTAGLFEAANRGVSTYSSGSEEIRAGSPDFSSARKATRLPDLDEAREIHQQHGMASPTFGPRQRKSSQASIAYELVPPLTLDSSAPKLSERRPSNASSIRSRKCPSERSHDAGPRRASEGLFTTTTPTLTRSATEAYTTPLPSLPFAASTATPPLPPAWRWSAAQASEPNTHHSIYQAELAKAVGKQRKTRPAALALDPAALSAFAPDGSVPSANASAVKSLASPSRLRAPPPSAPPTEPLPPVPDTPLLAPKSPMARQRRGSDFSATMGTDMDAPKTPKLLRYSSSTTDMRSPNRSLDSASNLNSGPGMESDIISTERTKQTETAGRGRRPSAGAVLAVSPVPEEPSVNSPAPVSSGESSHQVANSPKTPAADAAASARLSMRKKGRKSQEATKSAASAVVATEHADGQIVSPKLKSTILKDQRQVAPTRAEEVSPRSSPFPLPEDALEIVQTPVRRPAANEKPSRPPPSAWNGRKVTSAASVSNMSDAADSFELGHERQEELRGGADSVASCHSNFSSISDRRREVLADKEALLNALSEPSRQEVLRRTEGRFTGAFGEVARAFRQLQADKTMLEQIVREKTPLSGVGDSNEMLSAHLSKMNAKLEQNSAEIRKLLDLLEQQREVMEQMMATHQLEKEAYEDEVGHLHRVLDEAEAEVDHHRAHVLKLNEELAKAHAGTAQATADATRAKTTLTEEARKREKVVQLLRQAKERLREVESDNDRSVDGVDLQRLSPEAHRASSSENEVTQLRRMLEERDQEIASLRLSHADAAMHHDVDDTSVGHDSASTPAEEIARLRAQLTEQRQREKQIRTAYVSVREELRKVNLERRRSSAGSVQVLTVAQPPATAGSRYPPIVTPPDAADRKLKRLSLPIVARAAGLVAHPVSAGYAEWGARARSTSPLPGRSPTSVLLE